MTRQTCPLAHSPACSTKRRHFVGLVAAQDKVDTVTLTPDAVLRARSQGIPLTVRKPGKRGYRCGHIVQSITFK